MEGHARAAPRALRVDVVGIFGPTASGKSAVADVVADRLGTGVVSADAMQVYHGLPLLTNQPATPTLLVGIRRLGEDMSVGMYAPLAHAAIDELVGRNGSAVVAGGTGLYFRAAIAELQLPPRAPSGARERWEARYDADRDGVVAELQKLDPAAAAALHVNDRKRVVRALELAESGGSLVPRRPALWAGETRRPTLLVGLDVPPEELARRIELRTDAMFADGVVGEVRAALRHPISHTAEKALGLREIAGLAPGLARERVVARTKRYAAYQRKWMRRIPGLVLVDGARTPDAIAEEILAQGAPGQARR